jgi:hypothetical protein
MKNITKTILAIAVFSSISAIAQTNTFIRGSLDIKYNSRQSPGVKNVKDVYSVTINVANSALFQGTITDTPQIIDGWISKSVVQSRVLNFDISCDVVNPKNPAQTRNVGKIYGNVDIDSEGNYLYDKGGVSVDILPMGNAGGFSSKFGGQTKGKPLIRPSNWLETLKSSTVNITRNVNGKTTTVSLKKYDKMEFKQHIIAAGPVQIYQPVTVNGELLYDYDKSCWFFNNLTIQYAELNTVKIDRLSGTIRWEKKANEYQFDIRVNEPPPNVNAAFETSSGDESNFFETDLTVPSLIGSMKYQDISRAGITVSSMVNVDLKGNNITKQQTMALCKIIIFSAIVPMNAD